MKIIAIDGPAGSGKSSLSAAVASQLGFGFFSTGAIYRTVAYTVYQENIPISETQNIISFLRKNISEIKWDFASHSMYFRSQKIPSEDLHSSVMGTYASAVAKIPEVRELLLPFQRNVCLKSGLDGVVVEGRDIGTIVFPDADVKFYVTASVEERARRRSQQLGGSDTKKIMDEIRNRDLQDTLRETAPLTQASDAIVIDTSQKDFETCVLEAINTITDHKNP